jgi:hypothetical protein
MYQPVIPDPPKKLDLLKKRDREDYVAHLDSVLHKIRTTILGRYGYGPGAVSILEPFETAVLAVEVILAESQ